MQKKALKKFFKIPIIVYTHYSGGVILGRNILRLIRKLSDNNDSQRRSAAEALSKADERAVYPLIKALRDNNAGVQDSAMRSLISIGGETTAYMVLPLLREDSFLRNTAMIILKEIGYETVPLLKHLLKDKDDDVRKFAIDLLIDINHCDYLDDLIILLQEDKNVNVRASATKALGVFMYEKAIPQLTAALHDDEWVSFSALEALSMIKDESTISSIATLLNSNSETLRYNAIETLGKMGFSSSEKYLLKHFSKAKGYEKTASLKSLLQIGAVPTGPDVKDILIDFYINSDWEDRLIALKGIVGLQDSGALPVILDIAGSLDPSVPNEMDILVAIKESLMGFDCAKALIDILNDPNAKYRAKTIAIEIIEAQNCRDAIPHLIKLSEINLRDVKRASIKTLKEINGNDSRQLFMDALNDEDGHVRKHAVAALGNIGDKTVVKTLLKLLNKEIYEDVKEEIVKAILTVGSEKVFSRLNEFEPRLKEFIAKHTTDLEILNRLAEDDDINVRLSALLSFGSIEGERASEKLISALKDENAEIRKTALMSLSEQRCFLDSIKPMLNDSDMWVRLYAIKALGNSKDPSALESIVTMLKSSEIPVVLSAIDAVSLIASYNDIDISNIISPLLNHKESAIRQRAEDKMGGIL